MGSANGVMVPCKGCCDSFVSHKYQTKRKQGDNAENYRLEEMAKLPCEFCQHLCSAQNLQSHQLTCPQNQSFVPRRPETDLNIRNQCSSCHQENLPSKMLRLQCKCNFCINCFGSILYQCKEINKILSCPHCKRPVKNADIEQLKNLPQVEIDLFKVYQQEKILEKKDARNNNPIAILPNDVNSEFPPYWNISSLVNLSRYIVQPHTNEYQLVENNFRKTMRHNQIIGIERIQNRRWYRQYVAHRDDFIERYGQSTEQWLFHGCTDQAVAAIVQDCFNRSYAINCAYGQGIYFARDAAISDKYATPDAYNIKRMFMARVLIGRTTTGDRSTRICPSGFDTTGSGAIFVTYHDSQAYGEYLIEFY